MADSKQDETFRVVDRRLFNAEGELRKEALEQERQDASDEEKRAAKSAKAAAKPVIVPGAAPAKESAPAAVAEATGPDAASAELPTTSRGFTLLIDFLAGNAAARLGMLPDPRSGQAYLDLEGANELIEMLDALQEKTRRNLSHEEEQILLEVLRSLKLSYVDMTKAATKAMKEEAKHKA